MVCVDSLCVGVALRFGCVVVDMCVVALRFKVLCWLAMSCVVWL